MAFESQHIVTKRFVECVKAIVGDRKVASARQLALSVDYKPQGLNDIVLGKRNAPVDLIKRVADLYQVNVGYLFSGEGEMFDVKPYKLSVLTHVVVTDNLQRERIVHVPVAAHAGYRDNLSEPVFVQDLPTFSLPENILREGSYRSFEVAGDSMEPTLQPGDKVIGAMVDPQFWEQGIKDNLIHVLITYHDVVVKRVYNFIGSEGMLELHSDNSFHKPFHLPVEELREAWVVRLRITGNLTKPEARDILHLDDRLNKQASQIDTLMNTVASLTKQSPNR
jgi:phage repressor protein C with HTH and peptisase S24 domain